MKSSRYQKRIVMRFLAEQITALDAAMTFMFHLAER
jgi:hypothetical protein